MDSNATNNGGNKMAKNTKMEWTKKAFLVLVSKADQGVANDDDNLIDIYADEADCRSNNDSDVLGDAKWIDAEHLPPHVVDALEATREGELAPESSVCWTDAAIWKYAELEKMGVC